MTAAASPAASAREPGPCPADALWMGPKLERHEGPPPGDLMDWTPMNAQARDWRDAVTALPSVCRVEWLKRENSAQSGWYVLQGAERISGPWSYEGSAQMWALGYDTAWNRRIPSPDEARPAPAEPGAGVVPVECWAVLDPDGRIDIDNVWRSDEMAEWASELHGVEKIRVRITPIATPKERLDAE